MKQEIMKIWVDALRSGTYKQGKFKLRGISNDEEKYCCLGVLCDIYSKITKKGEWEKNKWIINSFITDGKLNSCNLNSNVMEWAGIKSEGGSYGGPNEYLTKDNDNGKSFDEIADIIEKNWEKL